MSLGATYQHETWSWTSRIEHRDADTEDKWGIYSGAVGEPRKGLGLSARLQAFETQSTSGIKGTQADLRLGLVHRPFSRRWTFLNRTDFGVETETGGVSNFDNWKFVNNLLINYRRKTTQVSTYYGAKYTRDTIDAASYSGYTDSIGFEVRQDINKRWEFGARAMAGHTAEGPYLKLRFKFDQKSVRDTANWFNRQ